MMRSLLWALACAWLVGICSSTKNFFNENYPGEIFSDESDSDEIYSEENNSNQNDSDEIYSGESDSDKSDFDKIYSGEGDSNESASDGEDYDESDSQDSGPGESQSDGNNSNETDSKEDGFHESGFNGSECDDNDTHQSNSVDKKEESHVSANLTREQVVRLVSLVSSNIGPVPRLVSFWWQAARDKQLREKSECADPDQNSCDEPSRATCVDRVSSATGGHTCQCKEGYEGDGHSCTDRNECLSSTPPCNGSNDGRCVNTDGGYHCTCRDGYEWNKMKKACVDIDECERETDNCDWSANCNNTAGGFDCTCIDGYEGDGVHCDFTGKHPCDRECDGNTMNCKYSFELEWYQTMDDNECNKCTMDPAKTFNFTDCARKFCITADGFRRTIATVNRQLPGPLISVCKGDTVSVNVANFLDNGEGATIHWHGLFQKRTPWMDGVPTISQCPIPHFTSFQYEFNPDPPGTQWYHSHQGFQHADGISGALVVREENDPHRDLYDYDLKDHVVFLTDWLHQTLLEETIVNTKPNPGMEFGKGILINGKGIGEKDRGRKYDEYFNITSRHTLRIMPLAEFAVEHGKRYRFRVISNAFEFCPLEVSVDGHHLQVIAADGDPMKPLNVTTITVQSAERFDFVLHANQEPKNYWLRVKGSIDCINLTQRALIRYDATATNTDSSPLPPGANLNPLYNTNKSDPIYPDQIESQTPVDSKLQGKPDLTVYLGFRLKTIETTEINRRTALHRYPIDSFAPQINGVSFWWPDTPLLTQYQDFDPKILCDTNKTPYEDAGLHVCTNVINLPKNQLVDLVMFDETNKYRLGHPFHLHGYQFAVIAMNKVKYGGEKFSRVEMQKLYESGNITYNYRTPIQKDTLAVPAGGYAVVRIYTDNPGVWPLHCHISDHLHQGMFSVLRVGDESDYDIPADFPKCGSYKSSFKWSPRPHRGHH